MGKRSSPRAEEIVDALDWLALTSRERKEKPVPNLTPLSANERRAVLAVLHAHESAVAVSEVLACEVKADALMPRPLMDIRRIEWVGEGRDRSATNDSVARYFAGLIKDRHALDSHRFRKNLVMVLQFLPEKDAMKILRGLWRSWRFTGEKHKRTLDVLGVLGRVRRNTKDGKTKREAVAAEAERRGVKISTVLGMLRDATRMTGERVQRPHTRSKRPRAN